MTSSDLHTAGAAAPGCPEPNGTAGLLHRTRAVTASGAHRALAQPRLRSAINTLIYSGMIRLDLTGPLTMLNLAGADVHAGEPDSAGKAPTGAVPAVRAPAPNQARTAMAVARTRLAL